MNINTAQRIALIVAIGLILWSFFFPSWERYISPLTQPSEIFGPTFILTPPRPVEMTQIPPVINYKLMVLQIIVITLVTTGITLILARRK